MCRVPPVASHARFLGSVRHRTVRGNRIVDGIVNRDSSPESSTLRGRIEHFVEQQSQKLGVTRISKGKTVGGTIKHIGR